MNVKELIGKYEYLNHDCFRRVDTSEVLKDLKQLDEPEKVKIPQFVADWIEYCKNTFLSLVRALMVDEVDFYNYANQKDESRLIDFLRTGKNQETFARAWLDGYEVEKEKRYMIKLKGVPDGAKFLKYTKVTRGWYFGMRRHYNDIEVSHTRKELEEANFGWVFDCEGIEIEEVEDDTKI